MTTIRYNLTAVHPFFLNNVLIDDISQLKSYTLFTDAILFPYWTSSYYRWADDPDLLKHSLESVKKSEGENIAGQLSNHWLHWEDIPVKNIPIHPSFLVSCGNFFAEGMFLFSRVGDLEEIQMLAITLSNILYSNIFQVPLSLDLTDIATDYYMNRLKKLNNDKLADTALGYLKDKVPESYYFVEHFFSKIIIPYAKMDLPNKLILQTANNIINIEVPELQSLGYSEILWLKKKVVGITNFPAWLHRKIKELDWDLPKISDKDLLSFISDQLWALVRMVKTDPKLTICKGIIGNIPLPIPINPVGVVSTIVDIKKERELKKEFEGIFILAELKKYLKSK